MTDATLSDVDAPGSTRAEIVGGTRTARYLIGALCVFLIALMLLPLALSFLASIKPPSEASAVPPHYLPHAISLDNYRTVAHYQAGLWTYVGNSLVVAFLTIALCLVLAVPAGYALARFAIPFVLSSPDPFAGMMIPYQAMLTPLYLMFFPHRPSPTPGSASPSSTPRCSCPSPST